MRSARLLRLAPLLLSLAVGMGLTGCTYDPHPTDGALRCSTAGECPEGYACQASGRCFSTSQSNDGGLGGDTISAAVYNRYIGNWAMAATAAVDTRCDDGFTETTLLSPDATNPRIITVARGTAGVADLEAGWLCDAPLRLDNGGAHLYGGNPSCMDTSGDPVYTWTITRFDLVTSNGVSATHTGVYTRKDEYFDGSIVNCNQTVTAALTKR